MIFPVSSFQRLAPPPNFRGVSKEVKGIILRTQDKDFVRRRSGEEKRPAIKGVNSVVSR